MSWPACRGDEPLDLGSVYGLDCKNTPVRATDVVAVDEIDILQRSNPSRSLVRRHLPPVGAIG
jgi:hypothetical protein